MVINVRGTSGSGKTTAVRGIMAKSTSIMKLGLKGKKPEAYHLTIPEKPPVYIIGSYENVCGGCDSIPSQDEICRRIREYAPLGHVIAEGLLMSHLFSRYAMLDRELAAQGIPFVWAFLDTPLDVCLERVQARRDARGRATEPLNPKNTTDKWKDMRSVFDKCTKEREKDWRKVIGYRRARLDARWVDYQNPTEEIFSWL